MRRQRIDAVSTVTPMFRQAELSCDTAAADAAACISTMLRVRADSNLPIGTGSEMLRMLTDALSAQVKARELFIEAHKMTPQVLGALGLRAFGDPTTDDCPLTPSGNLVGEMNATPLKIVA